MAIVSKELHIIQKANGNTLVLSKKLNAINAYNDFPRDAWRVAYTYLTKKSIAHLEEIAKEIGGRYDKRYDEFVLPNMEKAIKFLYEVYNASLKEKEVMEKQSV